ncbi:orotate phosphoribosyltransferase [bacterium]|nr:orotate phosphoribosyltransferase [bacterium]|tara:strand:- start:30003 stop:30533 length:531 start_codon:yes stop_codon:yes gene_type:complete
MKNFLLDYLKNHSILKGDFTLSSGEKSSYYIDARISTLSAESLGIITEIFYDKIIQKNLKYVGGPTIGADPIVGALLAESYSKGSPLKGFLVRSGEKKHGTKKVVEGPSIKNSKVVIVEDVVSTGGSILAAIKEVEKEGAKVDLILSIVDREMGAIEKFSELKIQYSPIFKISELI